MLSALYFGLLLLHVPRNILVGVFAASSSLVNASVVDDGYTLSTLGRVPAEIAAVLLIVYGAGLVMTDMEIPFGTGVI